MRPDIVIVDAERDLNVYIDMANDVKKEDEDVAGCCDSSAEGATSGRMQETPCCSEKVANFCSQNSSKDIDSEHAGSNPAQEVAGVTCCSKLRSKTDSDVAAPWNLADIDINEWAGKFLCC